MPGRLYLTHSATQIAGHLGTSNGDISMVPRHNIKPGQNIIVCDKNHDLGEMRWGMIPVGRVNARGRPVMETIINVRSETIFSKSAFHGVERCLVPASGWYEWTGQRRKKTAWRISLIDGGLMVFAAVCDYWAAPDGANIAQVATVTCAPSADVADIHDRMGVILDPRDFATWLTCPNEDASKLLRPLPAGSLNIESADDVDWSAI